MNSEAASDGFRTCEYCGCNTNAKLRRCCEEGYFADGGTEERLKEEREYVMYRELGA